MQSSLFDRYTNLHQSTVAPDLSSSLLFLEILNPDRPVDPQLHDHLRLEPMYVSDISIYSERTTLPLYTANNLSMSLQPGNLDH